MPRSYRQIFPVAKRDFYIANDVADFELTSENNSIKAGSIYISGKVRVRTGVDTYNNTVTSATSGSGLTTQDVKLDAYAGVHSFFRRFNCETAQGTLENIDNYPRLMRMIAEATMHRDNSCNESDKQMALQSADVDRAESFTLAQLSTNDLDVPFCFRPLIAFNSSSADIPYRRTGLMRISLRFAPLNEALFGSDWASTGGYWISDLQLHYEVVPDAGSNDPIIFQIYQHVPHVVNSNNANISSLMAGLSNSMSASFLQARLENDSYVNNLLQTCKLPDVTRVTFSFNDSDTVRVAYPIENNEELELNYQRSLGVDGVNSLFLSKQQRYNGSTSADDTTSGYGIGISFGTLKNLTNSKFDLNIQAGADGATTNNKYRAFLYFRSILSM